MALAALRWRVEGEIPNLSRFVIIAAPHTSNWDFVVGIAAKLALGLEVLWLGKNSLFQSPFGGLMRALGGMPVDRTTPSDVVAATVREFQRRDKLVLGLAPEGTRRKVDRWRTGFYHIAHGARVPIVTVAINGEARALQLGPPFHTCGDLDADIRELQSRFAHVNGVKQKR